MIFCLAKYSFQFFVQWSKKEIFFKKYSCGWKKNEMAGNRKRLNDYNDRRGQRPGRATRERNRWSLNFLTTELPASLVQYKVIYLV